MGKTSGRKNCEGHLPTREIDHRLQSACEMTFNAERVLKAVAEPPVVAAGNYFVGFPNGAKWGTADRLLDLPAGSLLSLRTRTFLDCGSIHLVAVPSIWLVDGLAIRSRAAVCFVNRRRSNCLVPSDSACHGTWSAVRSPCSVVGNDRTKRTCVRPPSAEERRETWKGDRCGSPSRSPNRNTTAPPCHLDPR